MSIDLFSVLIGLGLYFAICHAVEMHRESSNRRD